MTSAYVGFDNGVTSAHVGFDAGVAGGEVWLESCLICVFRGAGIGLLALPWGSP